MNKITQKLLEAKIEEQAKELETARGWLRDLASFHTEFVSLDRSSSFYSDGDERAPFFSEAFLYNLLGKEDARSVLARLRGLSSALKIKEYLF